ncbi:MAG: membrane protein insertion efficiency factor YidD [Armatimonadetes bacterium]|nr:membrane protein insertion efficiency factor YidD [Armatimonadota bacterium]
MRFWDSLRRLPASTIVALVKIYRRTLSRVLPPTCRFEPSCSTYMITAVQRHGALRGLLLGLWRIARCNPFNPGGYDPVPEARDENKPPTSPTERD